MAKIRLIENDTWLKFEAKKKELKLTSNALLLGLLGDHDFKTMDTDNALEQESITKDGAIDELEDERKALKDMIDTLNEDIIKLAEDKLTILAKNTKLVAKQKETILKKNEKLKEYRLLVSSLKKDNKKLGKQIKALTIVEDEEDGDGESGIHGPSIEL